MAGGAAALAKMWSVKNYSTNRWRQKEYTIAQPCRAVIIYD